VTSLDELFRRSSTSMMLADGDRRIQDANDACCELLHASRDELVALRLDDLTPEDRRVELGRLWSSLVADGTQTGTFVFVAGDGTPVEFVYSAIANADGDLHLGALAPAGREAGGPEHATEGPAGGAGASKGGGRLTPREREVITLLALGLTSGEVAERLVISPETVRIHVRNARRRLGARTRAQAIAIALRWGQIQPSSAAELLGAG
jgi:DNA-binding CsgD family transcriptional regulator